MALFYRITTDDHIRLSFIGDHLRRELGVSYSERDLIRDAIAAVYDDLCAHIASQLKGGDQ